METYIKVLNLLISFYKKYKGFENNDNVIELVESIKDISRNSLKNVPITCNSIEESYKISKIADILGFRLNNGDRYINVTFYKYPKYIKNLCYILWDNCVMEVTDIPDGAIVTIQSAKWFEHNYLPIVGIINDLTKKYYL